MFSRTFAVLSLFALLAAAAPGVQGGNPPVTKTVTITSPLPTATEPASQCDTGDLQCCDSTATAGSAAGIAALALVGVLVDDLDILLGITCSPISVIGVGGDSCSADPVCCVDNSYGGLISIGCVPVNLNL